MKMTSEKNFMAPNITTDKTANLTLDSSTVQLELPSIILKQLLQSGLLHGGDCKCLNATAKRVLWQTLLTTSIDHTANTKEYLCA